MITDEQVVRWLNTKGSVIEQNDIAVVLLTTMGISMITMLVLAFCAPKIFESIIMSIMLLVVVPIVIRLVISRCIDHWIMKTLKVTEPELVRAAIQYLIDHNPDKIYYNTPEDNLRELIQEYAKRAGIRY